ncbi:MAG: phosphotransferase [Chloroflexi bacterium]|nr:phosphotransferase [Chloroflexota bacterium]
MVEQASRIGPKRAEEVPRPDVGDALIVYLRTALGDPALAYASPPSRITGGFDTAIYAFALGGADGEMAGPLILRVFREGGSEQARFETVVQNSVAALGYPTPRVLFSCTDPSLLGGAFTIMPRVAGAVMLSRIFGPSMTRMPVLLARAHARLHALDPGPVHHALAEAGFGDERESAFSDGAWAKVIEAMKLDGLRDACAWVEASRPPSERAAVVCHGDFHPLNVMIEGNTLAGVLDWAGMRIAEPAWDVGAAIALFGHGPIDLPGPVVPIVNLVRRWLLRRYVNAYHAERPLDAASVRYYEAVRLLGFMVDTGVYRQAKAGIIPPTRMGAPFNHPRVLRGITKRFTAMTGVPVWLPEDRD